MKQYPFGTVNQYYKDIISIDKNLVHIFQDAVLKFNCVQNGHAPRYEARLDWGHVPLDYLQVAK